MKILIINYVSSSIKYKLMDLPENKVLAKGQRIGGHIHKKYFKNGSWQELKKNFKIYDNISGFEQIKILLYDSQIGVIPYDIFAIGHRVVKTIEIYKKVILSVFPLAPLHNPANLLGIAVPKAKEFAVFYTAFHHKIPEKAHRDALPERFYKKYHIRSSGYHGISHQYVYRTAIDYLKNTLAKIITLHLGNGVRSQ